MAEVRASSAWRERGRTWAITAGSIAISLATARLAAWAKVQKCRLEAIEWLPQIRISLLSAKKRICMPTLAPYVAASASPPADAQIVRSSREAPRRWKKRAAMPSPCTWPIVPA